MQRKQPAERRYRGFVAFQASCLLCGLYSPLFPFVFAFSKNASPEQAPLSAPMSATGSISAPSTNEAKVPTTAPIMAGMTIVITIIATIIINAINAFPILIAHLPIEIYFTHDQGLLSPFDKSERRLGSIIKLIVRNVKQIFMRGYILQIAVLIAASGAFGDQIK